jgi:hypothetical protein
MKRIGFVLALGCGLLAHAAGWTQEAPDTRHSQPRASALPFLKLEELTATRDRPLFAMDRRPQAPAQPPPAIVPQQPAKQRHEYTLKGVISQGASTFVLLEDLNTSETLLVRAGEKLGEWQITVDSDRSVTLIGEGGPIKLEMFQEEPGTSR